MWNEKASEEPKIFFLLLKGGGVIDNELTMDDTRAHPTQAPASKTATGLPEGSKCAWTVRIGPLLVYIATFLAKGTWNSSGFYLRAKRYICKIGVFSRKLANMIVRKWSEECFIKGEDNTQLNTDK